MLNVLPAMSRCCVDPRLDVVCEEARGWASSTGQDPSPPRGSSNAVVDCAVTCRPDSMYSAPRRKQMFKLIVSV